MCTMYDFDSVPGIRPCEFLGNSSVGLVKISGRMWKVSKLNEKSERTCWFGERLTNTNNLVLNLCDQNLYLIYQKWDCRLREGWQVQTTWYLFCVVKHIYLVLPNIRHTYIQHSSQFSNWESHISSPPTYFWKKCNLCYSCFRKRAIYLSFSSTISVIFYFRYIYLPT
jgi:hypothetical protein